MEPSGLDEPYDTRPSMDHSEEDAALALLNVSRTFLDGDIYPQRVMGNAPVGAQTGTRHSKRQPKPVKRHKNDVGGFEKKDYSQVGFVGGRGRGRSGRGPGRPPKSAYPDPAQLGMMHQYGYGYGAPMHPHYAPEYPQEYPPQYPAPYPPMYGPPPHLHGGAMPAHMMPGGAYGYGAQPYPMGGGAPAAMPGHGMPGMMPYYHQPPYGTHVPEMRHMGPPHMGAPMMGMPVPETSPHAPMHVAPVQPVMPPVQAVPHIDVPPSDGQPAAGSDSDVKDIRWMQAHLDNAVGVIGRKAGEPDELDTLPPKWKMAGGMYDSDLSKRTVFDLADYTQDELQDMADMTVQEARLPPLVQPRPGVRVSRVASYTGSKEFHAGKIYNSAGGGGRNADRGGGSGGNADRGAGSGGNANRGGAASTPAAHAENVPTVGASWASVVGNGACPAFQSAPTDTALAMQIASCWRTDNSYVWRMLGKAEPPVVEGAQINFLRLILVVERMGGYRQVTASQRWADVAAKFGAQGGPQMMAKGGHALRMLYMQHITPIWTALQPFLPPGGAT